MTQLEGLMMSTRSGDRDPDIPFHLHRQSGMTVDQLDDMLNRRSGLLGMTGGSDMRVFALTSIPVTLNWSRSAYPYCASRNSASTAMTTDPRRISCYWE